MIKAIHILPVAKAKMESYIRNCAFEISGIGTVEKRGDMLIVTDVFLLEQVGSAASTVLDQKQLSKFVIEMAMAGKDTSQLKFWWHSHVNFECYWSQTDQKCMDAFHPGDYFIGTVCNKKGESRTRLDIYEPIRTSVDNIPLITMLDAHQEREIQAEIAAKVTEEKIVFPGSGGRDGYFQRKKALGLTTADVPQTARTPEYHAPTCFSEEEFTALAKEMGMSVDALLEQENMQLASGWVF